MIPDLLTDDETIAEFNSDAPVKAGNRDSTPLRGGKERNMSQAIAGSRKRKEQES
jgi:hypothetical protein